MDVNIEVYFYGISLCNIKIKKIS